MDIGGGEIGSIQLNDHNDGEPEDVNISDVLEAIKLAEYGDAGAVVDGAAVEGGEVDVITVDVAAVDPAMARVPPMPTVEIVEQPAPKALRFRYECEGRSAGSIPGINNTPENKTYPTIRINDYIGPVTIVVSCVCKDEPFRPHPHNLVGRERCEKGVCTVKTKITEENREYQFKNLGIQCVKRRDIADALQARAQLRVDPFRTGFDHRNNPQSIDLNAVRLAFQVFVPDRDGLMRQPLRAVCSDIIFDKKAMCDLQIMRASHCSGPARGGTQIILLCEKVTREEIAVVFFHEESRWEQAANTLLVHKQVAVAFETPPFADPHTADHVNVRFQLKRLTDGQRSNSLPFEYIPDFPVKRKKPCLVPSLMPYETERTFQAEQQIKIEPNRTPPHHMTSPPHHQMYSPLSYTEQQQRWDIVPDPMALTVPGALNPFSESWQYQAISPPHNLASYSQSPSPMHQALSPMGHVSPGVHSMGHASPGVQSMGHASPGLQHSPMGHVSPLMQQHQQTYQQAMGSQQAQAISQQQAMNQQQAMSQQQVLSQQAMDTGTPSVSALLADAAGPLPQLGLNSGDLFSLSSMIEERENLSESLKCLSTQDLMM